MSSRFFHGSSSDSDSDDSTTTTGTGTSGTDSSSYGSSDESSSAHEESAARSQQRSAFSRFLRDDGSDSDGDEKRVVRSAKDKLWDDVRSVLKNIDNSKKINDLVNIQNGRQFKLCY
jgi:translation initiation factor 3 subunit C